MARGSNDSGYKGTLYYASIAGTKAGEQVRFELTKPNPEDKKNPTKEGSEKKLTGHLVNAQHRVWNYQDRAIDSIVLVLNDPQAGDDGESYRIEVSAASGIGRSIINSLLNADNFLPPLSISLYNTKDGGYANAGLYLGGEQLKWKYSYDDLKKYISVTKDKVKNASGKLETVERKNYLELNEFLLNEFKDKVIPLVNNTKHKATIQPASSETQAAAVGGADKMPWEEELPF